MYLSNPTVAQLGGSKVGRVSITDDRANDTFRAWAEPRNNYVLESDGAAAVRVRLAGQYEYDVYLILQTDTTDDANTWHDFELFSQEIQFAPYETEKTIHINILDDRKKEAPEDFLVDLLLSVQHQCT